MGAGTAGAMGRFARLSLLLVAVDFLDELAAGVPVVGAPGIQHELGISYGQAVGWLLAAGGLLGLLLEPPLFLLADRHPRRWFVCGGLLAEAVLFFGAAFAPGYGVLLALMALSYPASGVGVGLSQASLVDANPSERERAMLRWTLAGALGDLSAPLLFSGLAFVALGWRAAFAVAGCAWLAWAALLWRWPFPAQPAGAGTAGLSLGAALGQALRNRRLRPWVLACLLCGLLDELLVGFGALHLRDGLGADVHGRSLVLTSLMLGTLLGLLALGPLLRRARPLPLLLASSALCAPAYAGWLLAGSLASSAALAFAVGLFASAHYPIAKAQAYRALPEASGAVNAVMTLSGALFLPVPVLLGLAADGVGLRAALALLGLQPVGLAWIAARELRRVRA